MSKLSDFVNGFTNVEDLLDEYVKDNFTSYDHKPIELISFKIYKDDFIEFDFKYGVIYLNPNAVSNNHFTSLHHIIEYFKNKDIEN